MTDSNFSAPAVTLRVRGGFTGSQGKPAAESQPKKRLDYTHLDIIAKAEQITGRHLAQHTRTSGKYKCQCPFAGCSSKQDAFLVFDRPELEEGQVHFWCNSCGKRGSLMDLVQIMYEQEHGEKPTWEAACEVLEIDPLTWRQAVDGEQADLDADQQSRREKRRQEEDRQRKVAEAELHALDAVYNLACGWLLAGRVTMKDGRQIPLPLPGAYLQERGYTLEQAATLGLAYIPTSREVPELADQISSRWRGRIVFPLAGAKGARGYAGRSIWRWTPGMTAEAHKKLFEEWNQAHPQTPVARHMKTRQVAFYGYEQARQVSILVIVEGEFDAASVRLALDGVPDVAVAAMGKNFEARLIPANTLHVILALDMDQAGQSAIERHQGELEGRGVTVEIARPLQGKDWNDCHIQAGLAAIREALRRQCPELAKKLPDQGSWTPTPVVSVESASLVESVESASVPAPANPQVCACGAPSYLIDESNRGYCKACYRAAGHEPVPEEACIVCGDFLDTFDDEDRPYCYACLERVQQAAVAEAAERQAAEQQQRVLGQVQHILGDWAEGMTLTLLPAGMSSEEYIARHMRGERPGQMLTSPAPVEVETPVPAQPAQRGFSSANHRCPKHGRTLQYGDELGGRYCDDVDCWERYRLVRTGAKRGYPALYGVIDRRTVADTSKPPLYHITLPGTGEQIPVYADRPPVKALLIESGADAWHAYTHGRSYHEIDQAVRAVTGH